MSYPRESIWIADGETVEAGRKLIATSHLLDVVHTSSDASGDTEGLSVALLQPFDSLPKSQRVLWQLLESMASPDGLLNRAVTELEDDDRTGVALAIAALMFRDEPIKGSLSVDDFDQEPGGVWP